jgi:hypothetical protein
MRCAAMRYTHEMHAREMHVYETLAHQMDTREKPARDTTSMAKMDQALQPDLIALA